MLSLVSVASLEVWDFLEISRDERSKVLVLEWTILGLHRLVTEQ